MSTDTLMPHYCHAPGCKREVEPRLLMCGYHWRLVPKPLQARVWATYRAGQENDKRPSPEYLQAAGAAMRFVGEIEEERRAVVAKLDRQLGLEL